MASYVNFSVMTLQLLAAVDLLDKMILQPHFGDHHQCHLHRALQMMMRCETVELAVMPLQLLCQLSLLRPRWMMINPMCCQLLPEARWNQWKNLQNNLQNNHPHLMDQHNLLYYHFLRNSLQNNQFNLHYLNSHTYLNNLFQHFNSNDDDTSSKKRWSCHSSMALHL